MNTKGDIKQYKLSLFIFLIILAFYIFKDNILRIPISSTVRSYIVIVVSGFLIIFSFYAIFLHLKNFKFIKMLSISDILLSIFSIIIHIIILSRLIFAVFFIRIMMIS